MVITVLCFSSMRMFDKCISIHSGYVMVLNIVTKSSASILIEDVHIGIPFQTESEIHYNYGSLFVSIEKSGSSCDHTLKSTLHNCYKIIWCKPLYSPSYSVGPPRGGLVLCAMCKNHLLAMCYVSFCSHCYVKFK